MKFKGQLVPTQLIKRYKRFLADVVHSDNGEMTVHCPNTGSMKNCWQEDWTAWILNSHNTKRKYLFTWVLTENDQGHFIGINTQFANQLVYDGIVANKIKELNRFTDIKQEVKYGEENSRIDILLIDENQHKTFIEVKNVTLLENDGKGYFPDSVTTRGQKHLRELIHSVELGHRAVLFFLVQHTGIKSVSAAEHIDPAYALLLTKAINAGVEVLVYSCHISPEEICINKSIPFINNVSELEE